MLKILIDFDDTMECLCDAWVCSLNKMFGTNVDISQVDTWDMTKVFKGYNAQDIYSPMMSPEFWDTVVPKQGAVQYTKQLIEDGHDVFVVTASWWETIPYKVQRVLFRYFPFIKWEKVIIASDKSMIRGDILIDDGIHNLYSWEGPAILFTAPHNIDVEPWREDIVRADTWEEVYKTVKEMEGYICQK